MLLLSLGVNLISSGTVASSEKVVSKNDCAVVTKGAMIKNPQEIAIMNGMLRVVNGNFLVFDRDGVRVEASVKQPDYGHITSLRLAANGEIYAIGDQRTYKAMLTSTTDSVVLKASVLPVLYRKPCSWFRVFFGACQEQKAVFSDAVSAVFLSGYDSRGVLKSYVYGLRSEVLDLSSTPSPYYQHDCGTGFAVMVGDSEASLIDKSGDIQPYDAKLEGK
ncbi:hypothetical protein [Thiorhodococcus drewsii]|uniref:hypothetical protein n=1 Tax=Thiorhodococcus drewsii TaxID=210408 RepID=UPI001112BF0C|nr:hypothetical protein [Thiorhodococcus drewsii]